MLSELLFLFFAGLCGGILNSIAGGGSFITFPALIFVGVAPISANATNTLASAAGYLSGVYAFRKDIIEQKQSLAGLVVFGLLGGAAGAWLLLRTPESLFLEAIPWLLLFATILFVFGEQANRFLIERYAHHRHASAIGILTKRLSLLAICFYGGFFNAGLGIITLSYLALVGYSNINTMNGLKLLLSTSVSLSAIVLFIGDGVIAWQEGSAVLFGTIVGGYIAAHYSRQLPQKYVRAFVILVSTGITIYFFLNSYATE